MDWQDDEFETYLRQFRPTKPQALPARRRPLLAAAWAAGILFVILPVAWWMGFAPRDAGGTRSSPPANISNPTTQKPGREIPLKHWQRPGYRAADSSGAAVGRVRASSGFKPPRQIARVNPEYPEYAQAAGIEGEVILDMVVGQDGSVVELWVIQSVPELDQATIDAVSQWKYEPTLMNGEPVEVETDVHVYFTLP